MNNIEEGDVLSIEQSVYEVIQEIGNQPGDVLVFLPGEKDIHDIRRYLTELLDHHYEVLPLLLSIKIYL